MESQHLNALCVAGSLPLPRINIHTGHCLMTPFSVGMWSRKRNRGNQKIIYCNRNIPPFEASSEKKIKRGTFPPVPNFTKQILFPVKSLRLLYEEYEIGVIEFPTPHVSHSGTSRTKIRNLPTVSKKPAPSPPSHAAFLRGLLALPGNFKHWKTGHVSSAAFVVLSSLYPFLS